MTTQSGDQPPNKRPPISTEPLVADEAPTPVGRTVDMDEVKASYLAIIHQLDWDLGAEYRPQLVGLRTRIEAAENWRKLMRAAEDVRVTLASFARLLLAEREDLAGFISEVVRRLGEVEAYINASIQGASAAYNEGQEFTTAMMDSIVDFRRQAMGSTGLSEIKDMVLVRLDKFKTALETHRDRQRRHLEALSSELDQVRSRFSRVQERLSQMERENLRLSSRLRLDPLTGAHNRLALEERLAQEIGLMRRGQQEFSVLMLDLDHFKRINDTHGHQVGDQCLVEVVTKLKHGLRVSDMLSRYGGDEFAVVLPASNGRQAQAAAEKLRRLVADTEFTVRGRKIPVTVSIGVADSQPLDADAVDVLSRADKALYQAKQNGRNQVNLA